MGYCSHTDFLKELFIWLLTDLFALALFCMKQVGPKNICMCSVNIYLDKKCFVTKTLWKILPQGNERILEIAQGSSRSPSVENSL